MALFIGLKSHESCQPRNGGDNGERERKCIFGSTLTKIDFNF